MLVNPNLISAMMQNPQAFFSRMGINVQDPTDMIQTLMNSGRMSQQQYNQLRQMAHNLTNNRAHG